MNVRLHAAAAAAVAAFASLVAPPLAQAQQLAPTPAGNPFFSGDEVHAIWLTINKEDWWETLDAWHREDKSDMLEADLVWNTTRLERVGVRFKGNSSYNHPGRKKPFRIDFDKFVKGQKVGDISTLSLGNNWGDPTFIREDSFYRLVEAVGLPRPRTNHAAVYVNGEYFGVYTAVERINKAFIQSRLGASEDGNLFESDQVGGTLTDLGDDKERYRTLYELKTNESADDYSGLLRFIAVLNRTPDANFKPEIEKVLDVQSALAYLAVNNFCLNIDSYVGLAHNYYFYERKSDGKFTFLAWDGNLAWGGLSFGVNSQQLPALALDWSQQPAQRPLLSRLLAVPEYKAIYEGLFRKLADGVGSADVVIARARALHQFIKPDVIADTKKMYTDEQFLNSLTQDTQNATAGGGNPGGGGMPPGGGPMPPPGGLPPGGVPPGGGPGAGGVGFGGVPALETLIRNRFTELKKILP